MFVTHTVHLWYVSCSVNSGCTCCSTSQVCFAFNAAFFLQEQTVSICIPICCFWCLKSYTLLTIRWDLQGSSYVHTVPSQLIQHALLNLMCFGLQYVCKLCRVAVQLNMYSLKKVYSGFGLFPHNLSCYTHFTFILYHVICCMVKSQR